ncbi:hypothetical protein [Streptomyces glomeratus]|uniref:Uncharacterized protein n=1 Tax=Streptomyces glomeratus TaxID=284452 RepID=A0ABP6LJ44_9ACTN|nr:hypothetical protein [Streptomyces glomeratus]MCF1506658.1 hypothetical protein [Streptomyces glomeratus]
MKVAETLGGYYTSTTYGGTTYRVYHHTVNPRVTATVTPHKSGQCEHFQVQEYYSGAWHTQHLGLLHPRPEEHRGDAADPDPRGRSEVPGALRVRAQREGQHQPEHLERLALPHGQDLSHLDDGRPGHPRR